MAQTPEAITPQLQRYADNFLRIMTADRCPTCGSTEVDGPEDSDYLACLACGDGFRWEAARDARLVKAGER